jgi:hypothetical protein
MWRYKSGACSVAAVSTIRCLYLDLPSFIFTELLLGDQRVFRGDGDDLSAALQREARFVSYRCLDPVA